MIFSNHRVVTRLNESFVCSYESLRPVPKAEIDFGNGHRLTRTLRGNIATYLCHPDGFVLDVIPGLITPQGLVKRLDDALARRQAHNDTANRPGNSEALPTPSSSPITPDLSKSFVETNLLDSLAGMGESHSPIVSAVDPSKFAVERPLLHGLGSSLPTSSQRSLESDSAYNRRNRDPIVRAWLSFQPMSIDDLTVPLFKEVLGVDLEDPYLGLAPYVMGGEPGRH